MTTLDLDREARLTAVAAGFDPGSRGGEGFIAGYKAHHAIGCSDPRYARLWDAILLCVPCDRIDAIRRMLDEEAVQ